MNNLSDADVTPIIAGNKEELTEIMSRLETELKKLFFIFSKKDSVEQYIRQKEKVFEMKYLDFRCLTIYAILDY